MKLYHGSPKQVGHLDPNKGVFDPAPWAGVYPDGEKIGRKVIWCTPVFDIAIGFALKNYLDDLVADAENKILYCKSSQQMTSEMAGFVYELPCDDSFEQANLQEWFTRTEIKPISVTRVTVESIREYSFHWSSTFPWEE